MNIQLPIDPKLEQDLSYAYSVLNLPDNSTLDKVKKSYQELAKKYKPDQDQGDIQEFTRITNAYKIIIETYKNTSKILEDIILKKNSNDD